MGSSLSIDRNIFGVDDVFKSKNTLYLTREDSSAVDDLFLEKKLGKEADLLITLPVGLSFWKL